MVLSCNIMNLVDLNKERYKDMSNGVLYFIGVKLGNCITTERVVAKSKADAISTLNDIYFDIDPLFIFPKSEVVNFIKVLNERQESAFVVLDIYMDGNELQMDENVYWDTTEKKILERFVERNIRIVSKELVLDQFELIKKVEDNNIGKPIISKKLQSD